MQQVAIVPLPRCYSDVWQKRSWKLSFPPTSIAKDYDTPSALPYRIETKQTLGHGAHAKVYLAHTTRGGALVAVKVIPLPLADSPMRPHHCNRILREAHLLYLLRISPFVVKLASSTEVEFPVSFLPLEAHIVLEYIPRPEEVPDTLSMPCIAHVRTLMRDLFLSVRDCHRQGIIHADIKPANVLVHASTRQVKLTDFGQSLLYYPNTPYDIKSAVGTTGYKAPEIVFGAAYVHYALDLWSVGCYLLRLLVGSRHEAIAATNNFHQIELLNERYGSDELYRVCRRYHWSVLPLAPCTGFRSWLEFLNSRSIEDLDKGEDTVKPLWPLFGNPQVVDLLERLLELDPQARITADEALEHAFFTLNFV